MTLPVLRRSADRKVTNAVSPNGKTAKVANSFGLPSGKPFSCPGATSVCEKVCYAGKLEKIYSGVRNVLMSNWDAVKDASLDDMVSMLQAMIDDFRADCIKEDARRAKKGDGPVQRAFRIHWDGDFFSVNYAAAWAWVIAGNRDIHFWVYTRSFTGPVDVLPVFGGMADRSNLSLYLSVDTANRADAIRARVAYPWVKVAWLDETFADGRANMPAFTGENGKPAKSYPCPENGGRIALIDEKGSACIKCGICPKGRGDVLFSIRKR